MGPVLGSRSPAGRLAGRRSDEGCVLPELRRGREEARPRAHEAVGAGRGGFGAFGSGRGTVEAGLVWEGMRGSRGNTAAAVDGTALLEIRVGLIHI